MTPHDDQLAAARAAAARARAMPHILELDDVEREFLADLIHTATTRLLGRFDFDTAEVRMANELRERIRLPVRDRRAGRDLTRAADEMDAGDGLGAA